MNNNFYLVFDKTTSSLKIRSLILKRIKTASIKKSSTIIVLGGDGFMLQTLKKFYK